MKNLKIIAMVSVLVIFFLPGCKKTDNSPPEPSRRGEVINATDLVSLTTKDIQKILDSTGMQIPFTMKHDVRVVSITYYTTDRSGTELIASGACFIPLGVDLLPLISFQHGTEVKRDLVASVSPQNSTEGLMGLITSSMGYLTVIPDYPGFGISEAMHPYLHAASLVPSVIDFMRACRSWCADNQVALDGGVFLAGYSEGGFASLATQKKIEEHYSSEFNLVAVAPMAGPYDLAGTFDTAFNASAYIEPAYAAFFFTSYDMIYGWNRLDEIFQAPYSSLVKDLFNGNSTWNKVLDVLPESFSAMVNPGFVDDYINGKEPEVKAMLKENTLLDWKPRAPIHFFHGDADQIVPYHNVLTAISRFIENGATTIQLTTIPGGTHETTGPPSIIGAIEWFEGF